MVRPIAKEKGSWRRVLIGLGSNLGDRRRNLERAVELVGGHAAVKWTRCSSWRETEPVGGPPQDPFLNGAGELRTTLAPAELLRFLHAVEADLGRRRDVRHGPRTVDLDLLFYDSLVVDDDELEIPHPRICERGFVLEPLAEIAPDLVHPLTGRTCRDHWLEFQRRPSPSSRGEDTPSGGSVCA